MTINYHIIKRYNMTDPNKSSRRLEAKVKSSGISEEKYIIRERRARDN